MEKIINGFMEEFQKNIPPALYELKEVIGEHARSACESMIHKMDLVSREEFDAQVLLLRRSQEKLLSLEERITTLSEAAKKKSSENTKKKSSKDKK
ncbi:MAG: accessory factor UbiK family protein [Pseudomonadota bacterium]|nr:accessory factor UbiK family protein [Pseudomonadota bacterium]